MKRLLQVLIILFIASELAACGPAPAYAEQSPASSQKVNVSPTAAEIELPADSPSPQPSFITLDTDIPGVVSDPKSFVVKSESKVYENENYIFFSNYSNYGFYIYDRAAGSLKPDSPYPVVFTLFGGKVYYAENGCIKSYDLLTGKEENILGFKGDVYNMLVYNNRLYYSYCDTPYFAESNVYDLYSVKLNGEDSKPLGLKEITNFCLAGDKVYYTSFDGSLYEFGLTDRRNKLIENIYPLYSMFEIKDGILFCLNEAENSDGTYSRGLVKMDLSSSEVSAVADDCWDFALLGQYMIYKSKNNILYAYDTGTEKTYKLLESNGFGDFMMHSTPYGAYLSFIDDTASSTCLYRICILGGKASVEKIMELPEYWGE